MVELSLVTGTYNRLSMLQEMLRSFKRSVGAISFEIIICDGGSTDGTLEWLRQHGEITLIEHGELRGAIATYNDGAARATGRYVLFANDDITYLDDSVQLAYQYMDANPDTGIGLFYTNRNRGQGHYGLAEMPAHYADGRMTGVPYNGLLITPRWLGERLGYWTLNGARTYGGDNAFVARCLEAGWSVSGIPGTKVDEPFNELNRELQRINSLPQNDHNPDTQAYLALWPRGPELGRPRAFDAPDDSTRPLRILYAPIYEGGHRIQHEQKYGLCKALQRRGQVHEVDYQADGPHKILDVARAWKPDIVFLQLHYPEPFTPGMARDLRQMLPNARIVSWTGDVYNIAANELYGEDYRAILRYFDLQLIVNASALKTYADAGIRAAYWQNAYEPNGVGHEPDSTTPQHDVLFLGNNYNPERHSLGLMLKELPYSVGIYGADWRGLESGLNLYDFKAGCKLYRNAKLAISIAETREPASAFVSNRIFQACAAGRCMVLQQYVPGLDRYLGYQNGKHYITWETLDELADCIHYWLKSEQNERRTAIAKAGQLFTLREHSFERRVSDLFAMLDTLPNRPAGVRPELIGPEYV